MRFAVDVDGVILDNNREHIINKYVSKWLTEKGIVHNITEIDSEFHIQFGLNQDAVDEIFRSIPEDEYDCCTKLCARAKEAIDKLRSGGDYVMILTARDGENGRRGKLMSHLSGLGISWDDFICSEEKGLVCKEYEINTVIDDRLQNLVNCHGIVNNLLYFPNHHNTKLSNYPKGVLRDVVQVSGWDQVMLLAENKQLVGC